MAPTEHCTGAPGCVVEANQIRIQQRIDDMDKQITDDRSQWREDIRAIKKNQGGMIYGMLILALTIIGDLLVSHLAK